MEQHMFFDEHSLNSAPTMVGGSNEARAPYSVVNQSLGSATTIVPNGGASSSCEPFLGRIDQYGIISKLGGGGFGVVYLARDTNSGVKVALKTLHPLLKKNGEEMDRLREKFALVSRLTHTNIAKALVLHPVREIALEDDDVRNEIRLSRGDSVMVMDYAPGVTLSKWRRQFKDGIVPLPQVFEVGRQIASALDYAHGERIVHRDIKPSNVMVETLAAPSASADIASMQNGGASSPSEPSKIRVRILDFGLAAEIRSSMSRVSKETGDASGTRPYMAPEQWQGKKQDGCTDQYALACVLYELLAGEPPFAGVFETGDPVIMANAIQTQVPEEIEGAPAAVNAALMRALAKRPQDRFASCGEFVKALGGVNSSNETQPLSVTNADRDNRREGPEEGMCIFEINVGRADHINPGAIIRLVCDNAGIQSRQIGHITLGEETSFFQVDASVADAVREKLRGADLDGQPVDIRDADTMPARASRPLTVTNADRDNRREGPEDGMCIFEINVGRADHITPGAIVRLVCDNADIQSRQIGHITLGEETSFFQVDASVADAVREKVRGADLDGQPVDIRDADTMPALTARPEVSPHLDFTQPFSPQSESEVLRRKLSFARELEKIAQDDRADTEYAKFIGTAEDEMTVANEACKLGRFAAAADSLNRVEAALDELRRARFARKEAERRAREEAERIAREKAEAERRAREEAEAERIAREKAEVERRVREAAGRIACERAETEKGMCEDFNSNDAQDQIDHSSKHLCHIRFSGLRYLAWGIIVLIMLSCLLPYLGLFPSIIALAMCIGRKIILKKRNLQSKSRYFNFIIWWFGFWTLFWGLCFVFTDVPQ